MANAVDCVRARWPVPEDGERLSRRTLQRALGEEGFGRREWTIGHIVNRELYRLFRRGLIDPPEDPLVMALPLRLRDVLDCLRRGLTARQTGEKLELSYHTVRDYIKEIYQRLNVSSRSELLALLVPDRPGR